jgi:hypothetical protein
LGTCVSGIQECGVKFGWSACAAVQILQQCRVEGVGWDGSTGWGQVLGAALPAQAARPGRESRRQNYCCGWVLWVMDQTSGVCLELIVLCNPVRRCIAARHSTSLTRWCGCACCWHSVLGWAVSCCT